MRGAIREGPDLMLFLRKSPEFKERGGPGQGGDCRICSTRTKLIDFLFYRARRITSRRITRKNLPSELRPPGLDSVLPTVQERKSTDREMVG